MAYQEILYAEDGAVGTITLNRPDDGNMLHRSHVSRDPRLHQRDPSRDPHQGNRAHRRGRSVLLHRRPQGRHGGYSRFTPACCRRWRCTRASTGLQKPVIARVNGFAVGGGNVLQVVCDLTIAKESARVSAGRADDGVSFDAGYGTWYLEDLVGKKNAPRRCGSVIRSSQRPDALDIGLINKVVPDDKLKERDARNSRWKSPSAVRSRWPRSRQRSMRAMAAFRDWLASRTTCCCGGYLETDESHELSQAFGQRRKPDPEKFGH